MWDVDTAVNTVHMFVKGKLFKDMKQFGRQSAIGIAITTVLVTVLSLVGLSPLGAAGVGGFLGGILMPYLFKDLKYA